MDKKGSVFGGMLLITGCCVGAGMLGLPIVTGLLGFVPSLFLFAVAVFFMTSTGLLLVEVNSWFEGRVNFTTMVETLLGPVGKWACWFLYLFLFYALLVAYIAGSGVHFSSLISSAGIVIPQWAGSVFFVGLFGWVIYLGTHTVDMANRALMFGKIIVYVCLIAVGVQYVQPKLLEHVDMSYTMAVLPILIISFGFQNMIPTLSNYLGGDLRRIKLSIISGAALTMGIYLFWQIIALGSLPIEGQWGLLSSYEHGIDAAEALRNFVKSPWVGSFAALLAFIAILTSFLAQSMTLVHFLEDAFKVKYGKHESVKLVLLALLPPLIFSVIYPGIFYQALNFAGGFSAVILFGVLPVLMIYQGRYVEQRQSTYQFWGGKTMLFGLFLFSVMIVGYQAKIMLMG